VKKSCHTQINESCHTQINESCHTRINESCRTRGLSLLLVHLCHACEGVMSHTKEWVMSKTNEWVMSHKRPVGATVVCMSHTWTVVFMSHMWRIHVMQIDESCHTHKWMRHVSQCLLWDKSHSHVSQQTCETSLIYMSHNRPSHTNEWVMSHKSHSHVSQQTCACSWCIYVAHM